MKLNLSLLPILLVSLSATVPVAAQAPATQAVRPKITLFPNEPKSFTFSSKRPRLVVLMHGVTNRPASAPEEGIDTARHARWYWGLDMIQALMGYPDRPFVKLIQHNQTQTTMTYVSEAAWTPKNTTVIPGTGHDPLVDLDGPKKGKIVLDPDEELPKSTHATTVTTYATSPTDLAPVILPYSNLLVLPEAARASAQNDPKRYVEALFRPSDNPTTGVMVTFRDGSKHLMLQVGEAIDQIYDTYQRTFGHLPEASQPQLYLVGHSFGGVVARAILTNPAGTDLFGGKLTADQRDHADFIRRRVVHVTTMGAPHTGTPMADLCPDMDKVMKMGASIIPSADTLKKNPILNAITPDVVVDLKGMLLDAAKSAGGDRDSLVDIKRMAEYNKGILSPEKAVRVDGSQVPIYTMGGRNPGGLFFDRKRAPLLFGGKMLPHSIIDIMGAERFATDAGALYIIQSLLHRMGYGPENTRPWGRTAIPEADLFSSPLKGVGSNISRSQGVTTVWPTLVPGVATDTLTADAFTYVPDGENDTDGFCGFDSASGLGVTGGVGKPWWWKGLYGSRFGERMPWDMDNHGSLMFNVGNGLWMHNELIRSAGPIPVQGSDLSVWVPNNTNNLERHSVKFKFTKVWSRDGKIDEGTDKMKLGDYDVYIRIAGSLKKVTCKEDANPSLNVGSHEVTNTPLSVIPIVISVIDRDDLSKDDDCVLSPEKGRDNLYLYFDTRTGRFYGDATGKAGEVVTVGGYKGVYNPVGIEFTITGN